MKKMIQRIDTFLAHPFPFPKNEKGEIGVIGLFVTILSVFTYPIHKEPLFTMGILATSALLLSPYILIMLSLIVAPLMITTEHKITAKIDSVIPFEALVVLSIVLAIGLFIWRLPEITKHSCIKQAPNQPEQDNPITRP